MDFSDTTNNDLLAKLFDLVREERELAAGLILCLVELNSRKLHIAAGYSSLFDFCVGVLGFSRNRAYKRAKMVNAITLFPELLKYLASGELTESHIAIIAPKLTECNFDLVVQNVRNMSKREATSFMARIDHEGRLWESEPEMDLTIACPLELMEKISRVKEIMGFTSGGKNLTIMMDELVECYLHHHDPMIKAERTLAKKGRRETQKREMPSKNIRETELQNPPSSGDQQSALPGEKSCSDNVSHAAPSAVNSTVSSETSRYIPAEIRHAVMLRDQGRCTFEGCDGRRCEARSGLEFDHIVPFARGGSHQPGNLRLLCRIHNQYVAEKIYGREFMQSKIQSNVMII